MPGTSRSIQPAPLGNRRTFLLFQTMYHLSLSEWDPLSIARELANRTEVYLMFTGGLEWNPIDVATLLEEHLAS
jgi:hypothetical protein